jgi:hypothetical protein
MTRRRPSSDWSRWFANVGLLAVYRLSEPAARLLGRKVLLHELAQWERSLFLGHLPSAILQQVVRRHRWLAVPVTTVYATHFFAPWLYSAVLWRRDCHQWQRWNDSFVALNIAGMATYVGLPAAPPWMASERAAIGDRVERISADGLDALGFSGVGEVLRRGQSNVNQVAALPSMHAAYSMLVALDARDGSPLGRVARRAYPPLMGLALVAGGEHYVIDVVLGWAYALAAHRWSASRRRRRGIR